MSCFFGLSVLVGVGSKRSNDNRPPDVVPSLMGGCEVPNGSILSLISVSLLVSWLEGGTEDVALDFNSGGIRVSKADTSVSLAVGRDETATVDVGTSTAEKSAHPWLEPGELEIETGGAVFEVKSVDGLFSDCF